MPMVARIVQKLRTTSPRRLLWIAVLSSEVFSAIIVCLMSLLAHGRIAGYYLIAGVVAALPVAFVVSFILISLIDAIRKAEQPTGDLLDNSAVATFVINTKHTIVLWNKACEELTGVPASEMLGTDSHWKPFYAQKQQTLADVIVDGNLEDLPRLFGAYARSAFIANGLQAEGWYEDLNGKDRYIIFDAAPILNDKGELTVVIETFQDVTAQKNMEDALAASESRLRTIIDTEPECVKMVNADATIQEINPPGLEMLEAVSREQVLGRSILPFIIPEYQLSYQMFSEKVFNGEPGTLEYEIIGLKGGRRWVETRAAPLRNARGTIFALLGVTRDVTEHKRWEKTLQEQLRFLQILIDAIPLPVFYKDVAGIYQGCNKAFEKFVGLPKEKLINKTVYDISPKELADEYYRKDTELFAHPGIQTYESSVKHADGTRHNVIFEKATYTDPDGTIAGLIGAIQDITTSKQAEHIIKRNYDTQTAINWILNISLKDIPLDSILKQALDLILSIPWLSFGSQGGIFLIEDDPHMLVMKAQRGMPAGLAEACKIVPFGRCLCGRAAARKEVQFSDTLDDRHDIQYEGIVPHGHYCVPIMYAREVLGVLNVHLKEGHREDWKEIEFLNAITSALAGIIRRKRIEAEMQKALNAISRAKKEWQETFDSITDLIAIVDKDFNIVRANRALSARMGLHPRDMINRKCFEVLHGTTVPPLDCPHVKTIREKRPESDDIFNPATKELFRMTTFPYYSPEGELMGSIHIARDITEEKEKEAQLIVSERLAALGEMASGIAHEINNPLASIAGCSEGLLTRVRKGQWDTALFETYLNIIQEEVFRCKSITTAILSFVQKTTYEKKDININEMLDKTIEIIGFQGRLKNIEVRKHYAGQLLTIRGSEGELRQVFIAIITNALDAMEDKGALTLDTGVERGNVVIRIRDTGPGIPADLISKIFDPFFTTKSDKGGTGLGLSIARKIILNHGGNIDASSEPGKGTTFTLTFPG